jgi:hypothetical protein
LAPPPRDGRPWLVQAGLALVVIGGGLGLGLILQKHFIHVKPVPQYNRPFMLSETDKRVIANDLAQLIAKSKSSIIISARQLSSRIVLDALGERARAGIAVAVLLSKDTNPSLGEGVPNYLRSQGVKEIYLDASTNYDQYGVFDDKVVAFSSMPWSAQKPDAEGKVLFVNDPSLATSLTASFQNRIIKCSSRN